MSRAYIKGVGETMKLNHFRVHGDIDIGMSRDFIDFYHQCIKDNVTHVVIDINTFGGYMNCCAVMTSVIEQRDITWIGVCRGYAMSCGLLLLAACDNRYASTGSKLLFHDSMRGYYGDKLEITEQLEESKAETVPHFELFASHTSKPLNWWMKESKKKRDGCYTFTAEQALKLGVIDAVGTPVVKVVKTSAVEIAVVEGS